MPQAIRDLLHRRNDLGTFLVHLTKDGAQPARSCLLDMLFGFSIEARTPMGLLTQQAAADPAIAATQRTVCFTETPLEHIWMMCEQIENRQVNMAPYGLVFTKTWGRRRRVNPVLYADITPTGHDWLTNPINEMVAAAEAGHAFAQDGQGVWTQVTLVDAPITKLTPFVEPMGKPGNVLREWWWEREWRHVGHLDFAWGDIVALLVPEGDHATFHASFEERRTADLLAAPSRPIRYLDPRWGQERMIAALADVPVENIGPFPTN